MQLVQVLVIASHVPEQQSEELVGGGVWPTWGSHLMPCEMQHFWVALLHLEPKQQSPSSTHTPRLAGTHGRHACLPSMGTQWRKQHSVSDWH